MMKHPFHIMLLAAGASTAYAETLAGRVVLSTPQLLQPLREPSQHLQIRCAVPHA